MIKLFLPFFAWCSRVLVGGLTMSLLVPVTIVAFYSDNETATGQGFVASELRFAETPGLAEDSYLGVGLTEASTFVLPTALTEASSEAALDITARTEGGQEFCAALTLSAAGYLGTVSSNASTFNTPTLRTGGAWDMTLGYKNESVLFTHGDTCLVQIDVTAWQSNMVKEEAGYRDSYSYTVPVRAHLIVLNEISPRPASGEPEFIELYNNSDLPIDVLGWNITERSISGNTINHIITNLPISAGALVAYDNSLTTIVPPRGTLALKYNSSSYLNDSGDTVRLIDDEGFAIDEYEYTNALGGSAYARLPDGVGLWQTQLPTPGTANNVVAVPVITEEVALEASFVPLLATLAEEAVGTSSETSVVDEIPVTIDQADVLEPVPEELELEIEAEIEVQVNETPEQSEGPQVPATEDSEAESILVSQEAEVVVESVGEPEPEEITYDEIL